MCKYIGEPKKHTNDPFDPDKVYYSVGDAKEHCNLCKFTGQEDF